MKKSATLTLSLIFGFAAGGATMPYWATDPAGATTIIEDAHLTPTKVGGTYSEFSWTRCSTLYATRFEAKDKMGNDVAGYVCTEPAIYLNQPKSISFDPVRKK